MSKATTIPSRWLGPFTTQESAQETLRKNHLEPPYETKISMATCPTTRRSHPVIEEVAGFTLHRPGFVRGQIRIRALAHDDTTPTHEELTHGKPVDRNSGNIFLMDLASVSNRAENTMAAIEIARNPQPEETEAQ